MFVSFSSLDFPDPAEVSVCNSDEVSYTILEKGTELGKPLLVESRGYSYSVKRRYKKSTEWRCTVRNSKVKCGATMKQLDKTTFQCGHSPHSPLSPVFARTSSMCESQRTGKLM